MTDAFDQPDDVNSSSPSLFPEPFGYPSDQDTLDEFERSMGFDLELWTTLSTESFDNQDTNAQFTYPVRDNRETTSGSSDPKSKRGTGVRTTHPNQQKKGTGKDAKPDPYDHYPYTSGYFFQLLTSMGERAPSAKLMFELGKVLREQVRSDPPLEVANRWAKRRLPNAYAWLDRQQKKISREEFVRCLGIAKRLVPTFEIGV